MISGRELGLIAAGTIALAGSLSKGSQNHQRPTNQELEDALRRFGAPRGSRARSKKIAPAPQALFPAMTTPIPEPDPKDGAQDAAPWDIFLKMDSADVPDELLIAILIEEPGQGDPVKKARILLEKTSGSIGRLVEGIDPIGEEGGLSTRAQARLLAGAELTRRSQLRQFGTGNLKITLTSPGQVVDFLRRVSEGPQERFSALYVSNRLVPIGYRKLSSGSSKLAIADPVEVFRPAILMRASSLFVAHQHPSGDATPSAEDLEVTKRLAAAGKSIGITLNDSLVIGDGRYSSIRDLYPGFFM